MTTGVEQEEGADRCPAHTNVLVDTIILTSPGSTMLGACEGASVGVVEEVSTETTARMREIKAQRIRLRSLNE